MTISARFSSKILESPVDEALTTWGWEQVAGGLAAVWQDPAFDPCERAFGEVKVFRMQLKDQLRHYVVFLPQTDSYTAFGRGAFAKLHDQHWHIEQYHRMIKQVCHIERFQVRGKYVDFQAMLNNACPDFQTVDWAQVRMRAMVGASEI